MSGKLARHDLRVVTIVVILITLSLGCLCLPTGITPTEAATPIPPAVETEPPVVLPPVEPPITNGSLNAEGPWLLIETDQGLWAANADGSGLTQVTDEDYWMWFWKTSIQPGGNQVVFISPADDFHNPVLNMLSLPDGTITRITDLTSPETEANAELSSGDGFEALRAVAYPSNYAWSPDGTRLAFVGLMDGPSAEIYIYDVYTGEITRVSNDDTQNYWVSWSPDGNTLLFMGAEAFGSSAGFGSGFVTTGVWSASGDGTDVNLLYVPDGGCENLVGWLDATTILLDTWHPAAGAENLRLFDIVTHNEAMLGEEWFIGAETESYWGAAMYADDSGLYLLTAEDRTPVLVSEEEVAQIEPVERGEYFFTVSFKNGGFATFGDDEMDHQISPVESLTWGLDVAMYGWIWGWTSEDDSQPGAWITGPGTEIGQIYNGNARLPAWDQHNNLLFFAEAGGGGYDLYRTTFNAYYTDLEVVGHIDIVPITVAWLGGQ